MTTADHLSPLAHLRGPDPRASSTQSLVPSEPDADPTAAPQPPRRRLLLVYIHGFYGNNQSFRSFPAHVHAYLKDALADSHAIHTKIYPRYKTYRAVGVGAEGFSKWLEPHEDDTTDVVLVGHSMGGILASEVVLMPNPDPFQPHLYKHHILGLLAMDTPFLGLHPRIIPTGIASLFRRDEADPLPDPDPSQPAPAPSPPHETSAPIPDDAPPPAFTPVPEPLTEPASRPRTPSDPPPPYPHPSPSPTDPTFDPPFHNDIHLRDRSRLTSLAHFAQKHLSEGIVSAAGRHVLSHMEYAACLADYRELHARYSNVRALEDVDPLRGVEEWGVERDEGPSFRARAARVRFANYYTAATGRPKKEKGRRDGAAGAASVSSPAVAGEVHEGSFANMTIHDSKVSSLTGPSLDGSSAASTTSHHSTPSTSDPSPPARPASSGRKEALHSAYDQALKVSRRKLLKHGLKLLEKRTAPSDHPDPNASLYLAPSPTAAAGQAPPQSTSTDPPAAARLRKFCATPKTASGVDGTWVSVPMRDIDEVDAHVSMFMDEGPHYGGLVVDVGERVVGWVKGDEARRGAEAAVRRGA